jgi:hypothetical protein
LITRILLTEAAEQDALVDGNGYSFRYTRAIWKATSSELLTKQAMRKQFIIYKKYVLRNIVTAGIEAFVVSRNKFLYVRVKEVWICELSHVLTSSINSPLLLKPCDPN